MEQVKPVPEKAPAPTPAPVLTEVAELHRTAWQLYATQLSQAQLELTVLQQKANEVMDRAKRVEEKLNGHKVKMRLIYELNDADVVDFETGHITRAPAPPPAPAVKPPQKAS